MIPQKRNIFCVVVHFGSKSTTDASIRDFLDQTNAAAAIVVVDHGKEPYVVPRGINGVQVVRPAQNKGYAAGINEGLRVVALHNPLPEDLVVCCNNDVRVQRDTLKRIVSTWPKKPAHVLAAATMGYVNLVTGRAHVGLSPRSYSAITLPYAHGSFLVAPVATWQRVGDAPEKFFMYWEDVALSIQAKAKKVTVRQLPDVGIHHADEKTSVPAEKEYLLVRNGAYVLEHSTPGIWPVIWESINSVRLSMHRALGKKPNIVKALQDRNTL